MSLISVTTVENLVSIFLNALRWLFLLDEDLVREMGNQVVKYDVGDEAMLCQVYELAF